MDDLLEIFREVPLPMRWSAGGAFVAAVPGTVLGLVLGLYANPSTAWFAAIEVGTPAAILGGVLGLLAGVVAWALGRGRPHPR